MNPKTLGLPADDPRIQEAVAAYALNRKKSFETASFRPRLLRILQNRRLESPDLLCLALVGGLQSSLDGIMQERLPDIMPLVTKARRLRRAGFAGAAQEPEPVILYSLAYAAANLAGIAGKYVTDLTGYITLHEETKGRTTDAGLERLLEERIEARRAHNRAQLSLPSFDELYPERSQNDLMRKSYDLLEKWGADGRVPEINLGDALQAARVLSLLPEVSNSLASAAALLDVDLKASRRDIQLSEIGAAVGAEMKQLLKKNSVRHSMSSPAAFKATDPDFKPVVLAMFIAGAQRKRVAADHALAMAAPAQGHLRELREMEDNGRRVILPHADSVAPEELGVLFNVVLARLAMYNAAHDEPKTPRLLPPKPVA